MGDKAMVQINKIDAFEQVIKAIDQNNLETASEIMKVLSQSIQKDKSMKNFSEKIQISKQEYEKYFKCLTVDDLSNT